MEYAPKSPTKLFGSDGENRELHGLFTRLLQITVVGGLAHGAVSLALGGHWYLVLGPLLIAVVAVLCLCLQRAGQHHIAISMFIWSVWLVVALQSSLLGGALNPSLSIHVILVLLAGWLVGLRQALVLGVMSVACLALFAFVSARGWWHPEPIGALNVLLSQLGVLWGGFLVSWLVLKGYQRQVQNGRSLTDSLAEKVEALSAQQDALRLSERRVVQTLQACPLPIAVAEFANGACLEVNPAWETCFQRQRADVIGKTSVQLGFWRDEVQRNQFMQAFNATQRVNGFEVTLGMPDGAVRTFLLSSERFMYGEVDCVMTIAMDVTERKVLEQQLKELNTNLELRVLERTSELDDANRNLVLTMGTLQRTQDELIGVEKLASLGSLVAGVAHELNTPLGNALITVSALHEMSGRASEDALAGTLKKSSFLEFMHNVNDGVALTQKSLERAVELIRSFKQVAVDQESERRRSFDLHQTVHEIVETLKPSFKHQEVRIELVVPCDILLESFPGPLGQVLINLVSNALVHGLGDRSDGVVELRADDAKDGKFVVLTVSDNGRGIAPEHLDQVFDPFFTTRLGQGGSGLGLAVSHRIVTRILGGRIKVSSVAGQGSVFEVTIPKVAPQVVN